MEFSKSPSFATDYPGRSFGLAYLSDCRNEATPVSINTSEEEKNLDTCFKEAYVLTFILVKGVGSPT
jgi:hypothetical protein